MCSLHLCSKAKWRETTKYTHNKMHIQKAMVESWGKALAGRLNLFEAELSLKRHRWGTRPQEVGEEGDCTQHYTTRMTPALRWAAFDRWSIKCEGQSRKTVSTNHNFLREERDKVESNQGLSAYQPNALKLGQTGSQRAQKHLTPFFPFFILEMTFKPSQGHCYNLC